MYVRNNLFPHSSGSRNPNPIMVASYARDWEPALVTVQLQECWEVQGPCTMGWLDGYSSTS